MQKTLLLPLTNACYSEFDQRANEKKSILICHNEVFYIFYATKPWGKCFQESSAIWV